MAEATADLRKSMAGLTSMARGQGARALHGKETHKHTPGLRRQESLEIVVTLCPEPPKLQLNISDHNVDERCLIESMRHHRQQA
jgi:hypothetical protein